MTIWELRFTDGRGATFYTTSDVTDKIGKAEAVQTFPVAADVSQENALRDAGRCLAEGRTFELTAHLGAVAYAVRHEIKSSASD